MKILMQSIMSLILLFIGLLMHMFILAKRRNVVRHSFVAETRNPQGNVLSVFFISDIHRRKIDKQFIKKVKANGSFDVVMIGGDLAEGGVPLSRIEHNVTSLAELGQLYFIWGNNDREVGEQAIRKIITQNDGIILDNKSAQIPNHSQWIICGTDDPSNRNVDVPNTVKNISGFKYSIVATHTPSLFRKVEEIVSPELLLAGHMHGGQIRLGKYGLHPLGEFVEKDGKARLISNGYGTSLVPLRLGAHPESHIITINY